jgi:glutaredoxin
MATNRKPLIALVAVVALAAAASQWWASRERLELGRQMAALAQPGDIRMLSSTTCGICTSARVWFKTHEVRFDECFIEKDADCRVLFEATRSPGTPVILVKGKPLVGFDPERIRRALNPA